MMVSIISLIVGAAFFNSAAQAQNAPFDDPNTDPTIDVWIYKSRPDLYPTKLYINTSLSGATQGQILTAPYQAYQNSAVMYDMNGEVIWFGFGSTGSGNAHDFSVCQYNGSDHLCYTEGLQYLGYSRGQSWILDTSLRPVRSIQSISGKGLIDQHELQIIDDGALIDIYQPTRFDLSEQGVSNGQGWVQDVIFQEVNLTSGELTFEWSALDHIALSESNVSINSTNVAGTGFTALSPWDFAHCNSIDKNADGDYLISCRHTDTLYKVSGNDGSIIWRCGGKLSDFNFTNNLNWSRQHDARWITYNASTDIISLFNNAADGWSQSANHSAGLIVKLNHDATPPTVELLKRYPAPPDQPLSTSQGNLQILNMDDYLNSNVFINWGSQPAITEHDSDGNVLYYALINASGPMIYRSFLANIDLSPDDSPALYTYAFNDQSDTDYYMSWNGCTNCSSWRIYGRSSCDANYTLVGNATKSGFETYYTASGFQEYGLVEAVAADGTGIRNSSARGVKAFVPSQPLNQYCNTTMCQTANQYVVAAGNYSVAQTRSACAQQPAATTSASASSTSSSSTKQNAAAVTRPPTVIVAVVGLMSMIFLGTAV